MAGAIELVGSLLLLVGLYLREAAFIMSGEIAVAYFMRRAPNGFFPAGQWRRPRGASFCFVFLFLFFAGPQGMERAGCGASAGCDDLSWCEPRCPANTQFEAAGHSPPQQAREARMVQQIIH